MTESDAFLVNRAVAGGVGGLRPEVDFWPRRLPGLGVRKLVGGDGVGDGMGGGGNG